VGASRRAGGSPTVRTARPTLTQQWSCAHLRFVRRSPAVCTAKPYPSVSVPALLCLPPPAICYSALDLPFVVTALLLPMAGILATRKKAANLN
jgi:hypothetical protein